MKVGITSDEVVGVVVVEVVAVVGQVAAQGLVAVVGQVEGRELVEVIGWLVIDKLQAFHRSELGAGIIHYKLHSIRI